MNSVCLKFTICKSLYWEYECLRLVVAMDDAMKNAKDEGRCSGSSLLLLARYLPKMCLFAGIFGGD